MNLTKPHIAEPERVPDSDRMVSVLDFWPPWGPRKIKRSRLNKCCGKSMVVIKCFYDERCKVCGVVTEHEDFRDYVHCRHCQHVRDVTVYGEY